MRFYFCNSKKRFDIVQVTIKKTTCTKIGVSERLRLRRRKSPRHTVRRREIFNRYCLQYATERSSDRRVMAMARVAAPCRATATPMGGFSESGLRREARAREKIPPRLLHFHYIWCACLLNSLLSEEIRSAGCWPRRGCVDRAAVRYWGRGVRALLIMITIISRA